jgi:chemotaxis protein histidine kinase CheA
MSVVQENLDGVGGYIEISSELGRGTVFTLDVPQLIGLLEVELVRTGARVYAIPTSQISTARVWLASEIAKRQQGSRGAYDEWRVLNADSLRPVSRAQLSAPAGVCLVELVTPSGVALRVDELLGKALLNYPFAVRPASIPILDPAALLAT